MPESISKTVELSEDFNILALAVGAANLGDALSAEDADLTVFAPTDAAFIKLAHDLGLEFDPNDEASVFGAIAGALSDLGGGDPIPLLTDILTYHVSPGAKGLAEVAALQDVPTLLEGATFSPVGASLFDNEPDLKDPSLEATDVAASNGIIHVIDRVLIPIDIPGNERSTITIEAEDMHLNGYKVKHDSDASNDELIGLRAWKKSGEASTTFDGVGGEYDIEVHYFDEIDGEAEIDVIVNGEIIQTIKLDQDLGGRGAEAKNLTSTTVEGVHLDKGDTLTFVGHRDKFEFARIDKVSIIPVEPKPTIAEIAADAGSFDILLMALEAADLVSPFTNRNSDLTVFAPTDEAFLKLAQDFGYEGAADDNGAIFGAIAGALSELGGGDPIPLLTDVLLYHVTPGSQKLADVAALESVPTLLEGATFSPDGTTLVDNEPDLENPSLVATDLMAANGVVHVIDRVLIPLDIPGNTPSVTDIVEGSNDFNILGLAIEAAGLGDALSKDGLEDITVFAPTDAAFTKLADDLGLEFDPNDEASVFGAIAGALSDLGGGDPIPLLTDILLYHVSPGAKGLAEVAGLETVDTLLTGATFAPDGTSLVDNEPDLEDPSLEATDISSANGIIHVIDRVLIPLDIPGNTPSIVDIVQDSDDFDILGMAVEAAGLGEALSAADADLTVFAPTDDAFRKLASDMGLEFDPNDDASVFGIIAEAFTEMGGGDPIPLLTDILLYHVSPGAKGLAEVAALQDVPTLLEGATFSPDGTTLVDNDPDLKNPELVETDVSASNGIIHVIDRVLIPVDAPDNEAHPVTIEAEDMHLDGYHVYWDRDASEHQLIKLSGKTGEATTSFDGVGGQYDVEIHYFDEIDGQASIDVLLNGEQIDTINLDQNFGGKTAQAKNLTSYVVEDLHLERGDSITLVGNKDRHEFARIDKLSITSSSDDDIMQIDTLSDDMMI